MAPRDMAPPGPRPTEQDDDDDEANRATHEGFMREALAMAERALATDETPVGCVLVRDGRIVARGMNATNRTANGTRHAEFMAVAAMLTAERAGSSSSSSSPPTATSSPGGIPTARKEGEEEEEGEKPQTPKTTYRPSIIRECILYVTVEPCIMCASLLRQYGIQKVYFGASNERFGGTGGVLRVHDDAAVVEPGFAVSGGWLREEAVLLLRRFYVQQNEKAPEPRNKKERVLKMEVEPLSKAADGGAG